MGKDVAYPNMKPLVEAPPARGCQYIAGEPCGLDTLYCAEPVEPGSSYCAQHHKLCYAGFQFPKGTGKGFRLPGKRVAA